jgi:hypothetical protein
MRETIGALLDKVRTLLPGFGDDEVEARTTTPMYRVDLYGVLSLPRFLSLNDDKNTFDAWWWTPWRPSPTPAAKRRKISK